MYYNTSMPCPFLYTFFRKTLNPKTVFVCLVFYGLFPCMAMTPFNTSYLSFEIPDNWTCISENVNWICYNKLNKKLAREAVIILTAKEVGTQDNLPEYLRYLKQKKVYKSKKGKQIISKIFHANQRIIAKHSWVDGFHLGSEIPPYYTRYLASIKKNLAVLVTYSAHQKLWKKYSSDFNKSIASLRMLSVDEALRKLRERRGKRGRSIRDYLEGIIGDGDIDFEGSEDGFFDMLGDNLGTTLAGGALGLGAGGFGLWKFLKRKRRSQPIVSSRRRRKR